ncbi:MAG: 3'-5' exonuclease, partial [Betaproteobacteria bacterium]
RDMAVLYRVKEQGRRLAARLAQAGVPASDFGDRGRLDPGNDTIKLMTYHSSKGLEFPVVFMPCLECMPLMKDDVAGEAKLLYVGMTLAMERLVLTHHGDSRFVAEVAEALAA